jgi:hypothetical protein
VCGEAELGEMELEGGLLPSEIEDRLNRHLPLGLRVLRADPIPLASPALDLILSRALYVLSWEEEETKEPSVQNPLLFSPDSPRSFLAEATIPMLTRRKEKEILVDVRPLILDFSLQEGIDPPTWQLVLRLSPAGGIHPKKLMARFFSNYLDEDKASKLVLGLKITRKALF